MEWLLGNAVKQLHVVFFLWVLAFKNVGLIDSYVNNDEENCMLSDPVWRRE